jgi:hypothetical protein
MGETCPKNFFNPLLNIFFWKKHDFFLLARFFVPATHIFSPFSAMLLKSVFCFSHEWLKISQIQQFYHTVLFPTRLHVHQRMNANGTSTKWFIFLKQEYNEHNAYDRYLHYCWPMHNILILCIVVPWSRGGVIFLAFRHLAMSSHLPCPDSTDALCSPLGARPPSPLPIWRPFPWGPHALPFGGPEQVFPIYITTLFVYWRCG